MGVMKLPSALDVMTGVKLGMKITHVRKNTTMRDIASVETGTLGLLMEIVSQEVHVPKIIDMPDSHIEYFCE